MRLEELRIVLSALVKALQLSSVLNVPQGDVEVLHLVAVAVPLSAGLASQLLALRQVLLQQLLLLQLLLLLH